jgi:predicted methyltransferase
MSRPHVRAVALALAAALAAASGGCTGFKRWAYSGPGRDDWQKPDEVLAALDLEPGDRVADLGAGGGYFTFRLADAVGPEGRVYAVDVDPGMLDYIAEQAKEQGRANVEVVLAELQDPKLPEPVDLIFTVDTYHHLEDRTAYFAGAKRYLRDDARLAVIEFDGGGFFARMFGHYTAPETIREELEAAGYDLESAPDFLDRQSFLIFESED